MIASVPGTEDEYLASERARYEHELKLAEFREAEETKRVLRRAEAAEHRRSALTVVAVVLLVAVVLVVGIGALYLNAEHDRAARTRDGERRSEQSRECVASGGTWLDAAGCVMPRRGDG